MEKELWKGNEAIAEAAIRAGCDCFFGYPITPQSEVPEYMSAHLPKAGGVFLQSESEVAAINMVYGAAGAGMRAMTSSSSPGISLKQEGITYIAGAELPCVIVNCMRGGPGLGTIQPGQGDYYQPPAAAATAITGRWSSPPPMCRRRWTSSRRHLTLPTSTATPSWWLWTA